ncbi:hypothetical protein [Deinococcus alpinitundrae]|uniref:hypothetical protein n=1 Tax=Deinococcus alpinitundrae TaxID=468913 RepID=UPI00137A2AC0|nr:hypothetical protein [Deinococcus alpinitundrae]
MGQWLDEQQRRQEQGAVRPAHPAQGLESAGPTIIEGAFTYDALEDLLLYLCSRREILTWQLTTLAGSFTLLLDQGQPADIMFRPVRPIGAYVGLRALHTLFQQQGGQFTVQRGLSASGAAALKRRSLNASGENLLIAMAAFEDEHNAPAILSGTTVDDSAEGLLVADLTPEDHLTAFVTRSSDTPLVDVLQLFSVSRRAYRVLLFGSAAGPLGQIELSANQVGRASASGQEGQAALNSLLGLSLSTELRIEVSPLTVDEWPGSPLGKLDSLLLRAALDGALTPEPSGSPAPSAGEVADPAQISPAPGGPAQARPAQINPARSSLAEPPPSPLQRLGRLLRRR